MGYTHYFNFKKDIEFFHPDLVKDLRRVINDNKEIIQYEYYDNKDPLLTEESIRFNGIENEGNEAFYISIDKNNTERFCKTGRKPYDLVVCECLLLFKYYYKDNFDLSSDGYSINDTIDIPKYSDLEENWGKALEYIENTFGYKFRILVYKKPLSRGGNKHILIIPEDMLKYPYNYNWEKDFKYTKINLSTFSPSELSIFFSKNPNYLICTENNKIKNYIYVDKYLLSVLDEIDKEHIPNIKAYIKFKNFMKTNEEFQKHTIQEIIGINKDYDSVKYEKEKSIKSYVNEIYKKFIDFSGISEGAVNMNNLYQKYKESESLNSRTIFKDLLDLSYWGDFERLEKEYIIDVVKVNSNWHISGKKLTIEDAVRYNYNYDYFTKKSTEKNIIDSKGTLENIFKLLSWYNEYNVSTDYIFKSYYNNLCSEKYFNEDMLKTRVLNYGKIKSIKICKNSNLNVTFKTDAQEFINFIENNRKDEKYKIKAEI